MIEKNSALALPRTASVRDFFANAIFGCGISERFEKAIFSS
jgi:hypothetical protein